jgi:23S rRNA (uracil1939-C5)-methyltransferase
MNNLTCRIHSVDRYSKGCVIHNGRHVTVPGAVAGEIVTIDILKNERNRLTGKITAIIEPSKSRVNPECSNYPSCPGCSLRHLSLETQKEMICRHVVKMVSKKNISTSNNKTEFFSIPSKKQYRRRCSLRYLKIGTRYLPAMNSIYPDHIPIDLSTCPNHHSNLNILLKKTTDRINGGILTVDDVNRIREVHFSLSDTGTCRIVFVLLGSNRNSFLTENKLKNIFVDAGVSALAIHITTVKAGINYKTPIVLLGESDIQMRFGNRTYSIPAGVWSPVSSGSSEILLQKLGKDMERVGAERIIESGCGAGLLTLAIAGNAEKVMGIDKNRSAIAAAQRNAEMFGVHNASFRTGDAVHAMRKLVSRGFKADTLIAHGMRKPFGSGLFDAANAFKMRSIIVMSPSFNSWLKDIAHAKDRHWELTQIRIFDQIPHTAGFLFYGRLHHRYRSL